LIEENCEEIRLEAPRVGSRKPHIFLPVVKHLSCGNRFLAQMRESSLSENEIEESFEDPSQANLEETLD
jgi:hypothetical protein